MRGKFYLKLWLALGGVVGLLGPRAAMAEGASSGSGGFDFISFLPLILIFFVFYFLLMRPQQKKAKAHQEMLANLRRGDRVVTNGGLIGTVVKIVSDREVQVDIAENVRVRVRRAMISEIIAKSEPAAAQPLTDASEALANGSHEKSISSRSITGTGTRQTKPKAPAPLKTKSSSQKKKNP